MELHRYIRKMKVEISKYNIRYAEIANVSQFNVIKLKRIMSGKQEVKLSEFDALRAALVKIKSLREGREMNDEFEYLDKLYGENS
ncbi:hypothetical protein [Pragia fontium]|uniref:hypothetical protein n=1 Tax=Pragia fontium TaxID=82985 RepID=UPI00064A2998|nr:hypothetical protein [Pragia fontium]AKJ41815.1 hypothetical protein QQ39_06730 [Pragia fontium]